MSLRRWLLFTSAILTTSVVGSLLAAPAFALPEKFIGINGHQSMYESAPDWHALEKAGVRRFRMQIEWSKVVNAGNWRNAPPWEATYDKYFQQAAEHQIEILPVLYGRKNGTGAYYLKSESTNYSEWREFVGLVVARYGQAGSFWVSHPGLPQYPGKTWEVWNEPNLPMNCPGGSCNGKQYGEFLVDTSASIHAAQPGWSPTVLFGGLYMEYFEGIEGRSVFEGAAQAPGIGSAYNGLSIHPYAMGAGVNRNLAERLQGTKTNIYRAVEMQTKAGLSKPLWVTEFGWPIRANNRQVVGPSEQASLLTESYNWFKEQSPTYNIQFAAWYFYKNVSLPGGPTWQENSGLREANGKFLPSWWAYQDETGATHWPGGKVAFQVNTTALFTYCNCWGITNTNLGMAPESSPSIATLSDGEYAIALQANTGGLWVRTGETALENTGFGFASGTSPSIAALPDESSPEKWVVALNGNTGTMWTRRSNGEYENTSLAFAPGTSPSVAPYSNGEYIMAIQTSGNSLWVRRSNFEFANTGLGMAKGTSPSITVLPNNAWIAAFQSNLGTLSVRTSNGTTWKTGQVMLPETSPSIAPLPNNEYVIAYQVPGGGLWTVTSAGVYKNWGQTLRANTSPSITALPGGGYEIAFQAANGEMTTAGTNGGTSTAQGMAAKTSPSISPPPRWTN